jgi:hypothetical protein
MNKYFYLIVVMVIISCSVDNFQIPEFSSDESIDFEFYQSAAVDIFDNAENITGCSAEVLRGIACVESRFSANAVGDNGQSRGMFQLHSRWDASRIEKYGEFNPFAPAESAVIAGYIIQDNLRAFHGDLRLAVAAYRQGISGVKRNGAIAGYADEVLLWRNDPEKVMSLFTFLGITEIRE